MRLTKLIYTLLLAGLPLSTAHSRTTLDAPESVSATYGKGKIRVEIRPVATTLSGLKYHAVLLTDLSVSLEQAFGESHKPGMAMHKSGSGNVINFDLDGNFNGRFFVAARVSAQDNAPGRDGLDVLSPWRMQTGSEGLPSQTNATPTGQKATPLTRSLKLNGGFALTSLYFSVPAPSGEYSLQVFRVIGDTLLSIPKLSTSSNGSLIVSDSYVNALGRLDETSAVKALLLKEAGQFTLFIRHRPGADSTAYKIKHNPTGQIMAQGRIFPVEKYGYKDMVSTMTALARIPEAAENPVYFSGGLEAVEDTGTVELFAAVMLHTAVAHASPKTIEFEARQGIHNNYVQFFDKLVGEWRVIRMTYVGGSRLRAFLDVVRKQSAEPIEDPVFIRNHGTLAEWGKAQKERMNYAFYEGYSRLDVEFERPNYDTLPSGAGVMFRVSENISLFGADLKDSLNMFNDSLLIGSVSARRLILEAKDSVFEKLNEDGLWLKGNDITEGEQNYYTGISSLRLPLQLWGRAPIGRPMALPSENSINTDPRGIIVNEVENSLLKLWNIQDTGDTLKNISHSNILLHGNKRIIVYDSIYKEPDAVAEIVVQGTKQNAEKVFITQQGCSALLEDTSTIVELWVAVKEMFNTTSKNIMTRFFKKKTKVGRLGITDIFNNRLRLVALETEPVTIKLEKAETAAFLTALSGKGMIKISLSEKILLQGKLTSTGVIENITYSENGNISQELNVPDYLMFLDKYAELYLLSEKRTQGQFKISFIFNDKRNEETLYEQIDYVSIKAKEFNFVDCASDASVNYSYIHNPSVTICGLAKYATGPSIDELREKLDIKAFMLGWNSSISQEPIEITDYLLNIYENKQAVGEQKVTIILDTNNQPVVKLAMQVEEYLKNSIPPPSSLVEGPEYVIDMFDEAQQTKEDTEAFILKPGLTFGKSWYDKDEYNNEVDANTIKNAISPVEIIEGSRNRYQYLSNAGVVHFTVMLNHIEAETSRLPISKPAEWVMQSGHGIRGRYAGLWSPKDDLKLYDHNKFIFSSRWSNIKVLIFNSCYNVNVSVTTGQFPNQRNFWKYNSHKDEKIDEKNSLSDGRINNAFKWADILNSSVEGGKDFAILGWGSSIVDGIKFGSGNKGTSPFDKQYGKEWTKALMMEFGAELKVSNSIEDIGQAWYDACVEMINRVKDYPAASSSQNCVSLSKFSNTYKIWAIDRSNLGRKTPVWVYP